MRGRESSDDSVGSGIGFDEVLLVLVPEFNDVSLTKEASVTSISSEVNMSKYSSGSDTSLTLVMLGFCANFPAKHK